MERNQNPELGAILRDAAGDRFEGDDGMTRLADLVNRRLGLTDDLALKPRTFWSYLNGHRTPPMPTAIALCEELDVAGSDLARVKDLVLAHFRAARERRAASPPRPRMNRPPQVA